MATTSGKKLPAPSVPKTPSHSINKVLRERCGKTHDNPFKAVLSHVVCKIFLVVTQVYNILHKDEHKPSHSHWMMASGAVSAAILLASVLLYNILIASAFILQYLLYYFCVGTGLVGCGVCISGILFFDKEPQPVADKVADKVSQGAKKVMSEFDKSK